MKRDLYNLLFINSKYDLVIFDTNALCSALDKRLKGSYSEASEERKIRALQSETEFYTRLIEYIEGGLRFSITKEVISEFKPVTIRSVMINRVKESFNLNFVPQHILERVISERDALISSFINKNRIISLKGYCGYDGLRKVYENLPYQYELSETDFDFLITGLTLVKKGNLCALVSNDNGIRAGWADILRKENMFFSHFGFFRNGGDFNFVGVNPLAINRFSKNRSSNVKS